MVVACRTQQLLKSSKNVTISKTLSFSTQIPSTGFRNYNYTANVPGAKKNETLVRLCCDCRRFHSTHYFQFPRETRSSFTKLTPQELLLVNVNLAAALELSHPLHRVRRAILSENPTEELNILINEDLSRTNVQSLLKDILPGQIGDLPDRLANEDLLEEFLRSYLERPYFKSSLLRAAASNDVQSVIDVLNSELGGPVLVVSNSSIVVNVDAIERILITYSKRYIQVTYSNDFLLQIVLTGIAEEQIKLGTSKLKPYLADKLIPVECVNAIVDLARESHRSKRDLNSLIFDLLIRPQIAAILGPIQTEINSVLNNITTFIFSFYVPSQPVSPILDIITNLSNVLVIRIAEIVVVVQTNVNAIFANLINGTVVSPSRRRRDIDLEFENSYDFDRIDFAISHRRVTRSTDIVQDILGLIAGLLSILIASLNSLLKNIFMNILSSQYPGIGQLVTTPVRAFVEWLLDTLLPCSTCVSIV